MFLGQKNLHISMISEGSCDTEVINYTFFHNSKMCELNKNKLLPHTGGQYVKRACRFVKICFEMSSRKSQVNELSSSLPFFLKG